MTGKSSIDREPSDWAPFVVCEKGKHAPAPRAMGSPEGMGDRMRAAAFAEIQARDAFLWAAERFEDAPAALRRIWRALAKAEQRHLGWLLRRMEELGIDPAERPVSTRLWDSLIECRDAREFALFIASAEERGRRAGDRFYREMLKTDPVTAEIFGKIADEEIEHIRVAERFYGARILPDGLEMQSAPELTE